MIVARPTASKRDTQNVAQLALLAANQFAKRLRVDSTLRAVSPLIAYAAFGDSLGAPYPAAFLLSVAYYARARQEASLVQQTNNCPAWRAFRDDAKRAKAEARRSEYQTDWLRELSVPPSLLAQADTVLAGRCRSDD